MKCANCNKDFEAKRKTAKFCSDKCRVYANRGNTVTVYELLPVPARDKEFALKEDTAIGVGAIPDPYIKTTTQKLCKHGFPTTFCRFATAGKPCKGA